MASLARWLYHFETGQVRPSVLGVTRRRNTIFRRARRESPLSQPPLSISRCDGETRHRAAVAEHLSMHAVRSSTTDRDSGCVRRCRRAVFRVATDPDEHRRLPSHPPPKCMFWAHSPRASALVDSLLIWWPAGYHHARPDGCVAALMFALSLSARLDSSLPVLSSHSLSMRS
jgi:hypothetical protein